MTDQIGRRNLLAKIETPKVTQTSAAGDEHLIREAAERHGFTAAGSAQPNLRRKRSGTGRTYQLNVRLRPDTAGLIYEEANRRDIPIAQVIEEAFDAFLAQQRTPERF